MADPGSVASDYQRREISGWADDEELEDPINVEETEAAEA